MKIEHDYSKVMQEMKRLGIWDAVEQCPLPIVVVARYPHLFYVQAGPPALAAWATYDDEVSFAVGLDSITVERCRPGDYYYSGCLDGEKPTGMVGGKIT